MRKRITNPEKLVFKLMVVLGLATVIFMAGFYSSQRKNFVFRGLLNVRESFREVAPDILKTVSNEPVDFLQPARYSGDGVTINNAAKPDDLILLLGFFNDMPGLRLISRTGEIVTEWRTVHSEIFNVEKAETWKNLDWRRDVHGGVALPDGSVIFNLEYGGTAKLDRCGGVVWALPDLQGHHSVELAEAGGMWIPGRYTHDDISTDSFPPFTYAKDRAPLVKEDLITRISEDGEVLTIKSVPEILSENGLGPLLTANGQLIADNFKLGDGGELVHLNKIAELKSDIADRFPMFEAGDLLVSVRTYNLIFVVDPDTWKIKWHRIGPWLRQHNPIFEDDGTISVFNNNTFLVALDDDLALPDIPLTSNIMRVDPSTAEVSIVYGQQEEQEFGTVVRGRHEITPAGGYIMTEFDGGRVFEIDTDGNVVWEYINRYDDDRVAEITGAVVYPASYFDVEDWSCAETQQ